jgi:hypothetical protein
VLGAPGCSPGLLLKASCGSNPRTRGGGCGSRLAQPDRCHPRTERTQTAHGPGDSDAADWRDPPDLDVAAYLWGGREGSGVQTRSDAWDPGRLLSTGRTCRGPLVVGSGDAAPRAPGFRAGAFFGSSSSFPGWRSSAPSARLSERLRSSIAGSVLPSLALRRCALHRRSVAVRFLAVGMLARPAQSTVGGCVARNGCIACRDPGRVRRRCPQPCSGLAAP